VGYFFYCQLVLGWNFTCACCHGPWLKWALSLVLSNSGIRADCAFRWLKKVWHGGPYGEAWWSNMQVLIEWKYVCCSVARWGTHSWYSYNRVNSMEAQGRAVCGLCGVECRCALDMVAWHHGNDFCHYSRGSLLWSRRDSCMRGRLLEMSHMSEGSRIRSMKRRIMIYKPSGLLLLLPIDFMMEPYLYLLPLNLIEVSTLLGSPQHDTYLTF